MQVKFVSEVVRHLYSWQMPGRPLAQPLLLIHHTLSLVPRLSPCANYKRWKAVWGLRTRLSYSPLLLAAGRYLVQSDRLGSQWLIFVFQPALFPSRPHMQSAETGDYRPPVVCGTRKKRLNSYQHLTPRPLSSQYPTSISDDLAF